MARATNKLTAVTVTRTKEPGRYGDGDGLYLIVEPTGSRRWQFLFRQGGKQREMGLGPANLVTLADARRKRDEARRLILDGHNPIEARRAAGRPTASVPTFGAIADSLIPELCKGYRNEKHKAQWASTINTYAATLREKAIDTITTDDVLACLRPIWTEKNETASRVRGRIERILDAAKAKGLRSGENPARWRGHLDQLLSKRQKLQRGHHPAMPFEDVPAFMAALRLRSGTAALALEWLILTGARSKEVRGARWDEIDRTALTWTVPAERMKAKKTHRKPVTASILAILDKAEETRRGPLIFPSHVADKMLSDAAFEALLSRMKVTGAVPHGFRSSLRDWAGEMTDHPREVAEAALAHAVGDATEQAYRRADALAKRRALMTDWDTYCRGAMASVEAGPLRATDVA